MIWREGLMVNINKLKAKIVQNELSVSQLDDMIEASVLELNRWKEAHNKKET